MLNAGATILDLGGQSTRPKALRISEDEELNRVMPYLQLLIEEFPNAIVSIDSFYSKVVGESITAGACIVNDISAGTIDEKMFDTVAKLQAPYILVHIHGEPSTMHQNIQYSDVVGEVTHFFSQKITALRYAGVHDIILDVGFGFGKKQDHNFSLLKHLSEFEMFGLPILSGISRKKMIQSTLGVSASNALVGTTAANMISLMNGTNILRVHDVKEAVETIKIYTAMRDAQ